MQIIGRKELVNIKIGDCKLESAAKIDSGAYGCSMHVQEIYKSGLRLTENNTYIQVPMEESEIIVVLDNGSELSFLPDEVKYKTITSSNGTKEDRLLVKVKLKIGNIKKRYITNMTFTNRQDMRHKILIGRKVLKNRFMIDVSKEFTLS